MKRNMFVAAGTALVLAFSLNNSQAQNDAPPAALAPVTNAAPPVSSFQNNLNRIRANDANPPPGALPGAGPQQFQRMPPPRFRQPHLAYNRALGDLRMVKLELEHAQGDLGGHKDSAIEACNKAIQELTAVMKSLPQPPPPQQPLQPPFGGTPTPTPLRAAPPATPAAPPQP